MFWISIGDYHLGSGDTPRAALRSFWRECWRIALEAIKEPQPDMLQHTCMRMCSEQQPWNWHRAVMARV